MRCDWLEPSIFLSLLKLEHGFIIRYRGRHGKICAILFKSYVQFLKPSIPDALQEHAHVQVI